MRTSATLVAALVSAFAALHSGGAESRPDNPFDPAKAEMEAEQDRERRKGERKRRERQERAAAQDRAEPQESEAASTPQVSIDELGPFQGCFQRMAVYAESEEGGGYLTMAPETLPAKAAKGRACADKEGR